MSENNGSPGPEKPEEQQQTEHLNIKVTDNNNEVFFKIKRSTQLKKLMDAFCERQGKAPASVRFLFDGQRVNSSDTPDTVGTSLAPPALHGMLTSSAARDDRRRYLGSSPGANRWLLVIAFPPLAAEAAEATSGALCCPHLCGRVARLQHDHYVDCGKAHISAEGKASHGRHLHTALT